MVKNVADHVDSLTGEVNDTALAEDAASHFGTYGPAPDYEIPPEYFDWAIEIANQHEIKTGVKFGGITAMAAGLINSRDADSF